jgi:hypothetical protein
MTELALLRSPSGMNPLATIDPLTAKNINPQKS